MTIETRAARRIPTLRRAAARRSLGALAPAALLLALAGAPALAQDAETSDEAHRDLEAHEHGHGDLEIAVEGNKIYMRLESPGMDIVGFERMAVNEPDQQAVQVALDYLRAPGQLFTFLPGASGCETKSAEVHQHHSGEHSAFEAEYEIECKDASAVRMMGFPFFSVFPAAGELEVTVAGPVGARTYEASHAQRVIKFPEGL